MKTKFIILLFFITTASLWTWDYEAFIKIKKVNSFQELDSAIVPWVEKINGVDRYHFRERSLQVPVSVSIAEKICPMNKVNLFWQSFDSIMVVSLSDSRFAIYRFGKLIRWGPTTCGTVKKPTPIGLYFTNEKKKADKWKRSSRYNNAPMFFSRQINHHVFIHHGPIVGRRDSHGCIRLLRQDAEWFYDWAPTGFPVQVTEKRLDDFETNEIVD